MRHLLTLTLCGIAATATASFLQYEADPLLSQVSDKRRFPASGADLNLQPVIGIVAQTLEPEMQVDPRF